MVDKTPTESSKFRTRNCVEITYESRGTNNVSNQIKFICLMIRSYLFDYSDAYILFSGTVTNNRAGTSDASERADEKKIYSTHK